MFANAIIELLNFTGETATLVTDASVTRSADGMTLTRSTTSQTVKVAFRNATVKEIAGQIGEGKRVCYLGARDLTAAPTKNDKIVTSDGYEYSITSIESRKHKNDVIAYILAVQGGANV